MCLFLLSACTDQPPDELFLATPTPNQSLPTAQPTIPEPSTPTPVIVLAPPTPEPTYAIDHNVINVPTDQAGASLTPSIAAELPSAPLPRLSGTLPDLSSLPPLSGTLQTGRLLARYQDQAKDEKGQPQVMRAAVMSPDHKWLALADRSQIWVFSLADGKLLQTLYSSSSDGTERGASSLAWSADGNFLAAGGLNGIVTMWRWDRSTGNFRVGPQRLSPNPMAESFGDAVEVAFSPDSKLVAGFGSDGQITVYGADTGEIKGVFQSDFAGHISWSSDSRRLSDEFFLQHNLDLNSGQSLPPDDAIQVAAEGPAGVAWSPDGKLIAGSGEDYELLLVEAPASGQPASKIVKEVKVRPDLDTNSLAHLSEGRAVAWSPDSAMVAVANVPRPGQVSFYDTTGQLLLTLTAAKATLTGLSWPLGNLVITTDNDGSAALWQLVGSPPPTPLALPIPALPFAPTPTP